MPTADEMTVRAHFDAHTKYLKLVEDKKELIAKYKAAKEQAKQKQFKAAEGLD